MRVDPLTLDWLRLTLVPGVSPLALQRALQAFGLPGKVLTAPPGALREVAGNAAANALAKGAAEADVDAAVRWLGADHRTLVTLADAAYPQLLLATPLPPPVLYAIGRVELLQSPAVAIVGSRSATPQGLRDAEQFARALGEAGVTVVSGLAAGIDAAAHRGALPTRGSTIAVLGTGADRVYPARNHDLAHRIAETGLILSEFPLGTPPVRTNFPRRNRIISGLARGCLVVEAALESGSLITARVAADQGRDVFALPGSIHSPVARGCHALIKQGAKLVERVEDIVEELGFQQQGFQKQGLAALPSAPTATVPAVDENQHALLAAMGHAPIDIDTLCARAGLTPDVVSAILMTLELEGRIGALPGGRFQQLAR